MHKILVLGCIAHYLLAEVGAILQCATWKESNQPLTQMWYMPHRALYNLMTSVCVEELHEEANDKMVYFVMLMCVAIDTKWASQTIS